VNATSEVSWEAGLPPVRLWLLGGAGAGGAGEVMILVWDAGVDELTGDHLREVFTPEDDTGPDGKVHLEGEADLFCMCGIGGSADKRDSHFLEVFTSADSVGRDGVEHRLVA
jgi:hypothetical protein